MSDRIFGSDGTGTKCLTSAAESRPSHEAGGFFEDKWSLHVSVDYYGTFQRTYFSSITGNTIWTGDHSPGISMHILTTAGRFGSPNILTYENATEHSNINITSGIHPLFFNISAAHGFVMGTYAARPDDTLPSFSSTIPGIGRNSCMNPGNPLIFCCNLGR